MNNPSVQQLHPLTAAAAVAVILVCLLGVALMTGVMPELTEKAQATYTKLGSAQDGAVPAEPNAVRAGTPTLSDSLAPGESLVPAEPEASSGASASGATAAGGPAPEDAPAAGATAAPSGSDPSVGTGSLKPVQTTLDAPAAIPDHRSGDRAMAGRPAVYVHVLNEATRRRIQQLEPVLAARGIKLAGIRVVGAGPGVSDMRYFRPAEREEALAVRKVLLSLGLPAQKLKRIEGFEPVATAHQYEVWLAADYSYRPASAAGR